MNLSILHVHTVPVISGSGINTLLTMRESRQRGHHVALACSAEGPLTREAARYGIRTYAIPEMDREIAPLQDSISVFKLARLMRTAGFTVVHTHNSKAGVVGRLASRLAGVPLTVHTVHGFAFHENETFLRRKTFVFLERRAANWCDGLIFISKPLLDWAARENIGSTVRKTVIYSGIADEDFKNADGTSVRRELRIPAERPVVGVVSKLWEGKGHAVLLGAWKKVVNAGLDPAPVLLVVGEGPLESALRKRIQDFGLTDTVIMTGFRSDVPEITASLDIAVLPSFYEGMGRVVLEAMAAGKPVVGSRVGGIPDLIAHGETGFLTEPGNEQDLADRLYSLLRDSNLRNKMGLNGRKAFKSEYSSSVMVRKIHDFYDDLLSSKT